MRAREPDRVGWVERDGNRLGYEVFGAGDPTVLLMPTWTIIHSRFWKMQVPYLSRRYRVITYDGPGNGRSDRTTDPSRYAADAYAADAAAVLDESATESAVVVGVSLGAQYSLRLAALHPHRVRALVLVGSALPLAPDLPERQLIADNFRRPYPDRPEGWEKYNLAYWHDHYKDFAQFFFDAVFTEPHSTKPREDAVNWALETSPQVLAASANRPRSGLTGREFFAEISCPILLIHGTADEIHSYDVGVEAARLSGGTLLTMEGSGHLPNLRDPVRVNLALRRFIESVAA